MQPMRFVDIAGLVRGASTGKAGQRVPEPYPRNRRDRDGRALLRGPDVIHVEGEPDPLRDIEIIDIEMALADLATLASAVEKLEREARANPKLRRSWRRHNACARRSKKASRRGRSPTDSLETELARESFCSAPSRFSTSRMSTRRRSASPGRWRAASSTYAPSAKGSGAIAFCGKIEAELAGPLRRRSGRHSARARHRTQRSRTAHPEPRTTCWD